MYTISLDPHCHLLPGPALHGVAGARWDATAGKLVIDGHAIGMPSLYSPEALIKWLDQNHIKNAWVSAPPPLYRAGLDPSTAAVWNDAVHNGLCELISPYADRLAVMRLLPIEHPALAAEIVRASPLQDKLFTLSAGEAGLLISGADWEPLWEVLDGRGATVLMHPGEGGDTRLAPYYLGNLLGNPVETSIAVAHLVFSGVVARRPAIRWLLAHAGGATAMLAARWQQGYSTSRPGVDLSQEQPLVALKRFTVDWITHSPEGLTLAAAVFGKDKVIYGSDWPFPMGTLDPQAMLSQLSATEVSQLLDNTDSFSAG